MANLPEVVEQTKEKLEGAKEYLAVALAVITIYQFVNKRATSEDPKSSEQKDTTE